MNSIIRHRRFTFLQGIFSLILMVALSGPALAEQINLNQADAETLQYIPGIGPAKSKEIVQLRETTQGFKTMEDLLAVPGIGTKTLEVIKKHGSLDSGVSTLTDEMRSNPPKKVTQVKETSTASNS